MKRMGKVSVRNVWTEGHVAALLATYFVFLNCQRGGDPYQKAAVVRLLAAEQSRTKGSVECKMMNVSAVLHDQGHDWVTGYKPLSNYNKALSDQVLDYIAKNHTRLAA